MPNFRVVFHVDEIERWGLLLTNVANLLVAAEGDTIEVKVVANAVAVRQYVRSEGEHVEAMAQLARKGVLFVACNNALRSQNIDPSALLDFVEVVPAGVMELVRLQHQGYAYLKP